jgi:hypothetical protein
MNASSTGWIDQQLIGAAACVGHSVLARPSCLDACTLAACQPELCDLALPHVPGDLGMTLAG